MLRPLLSHLNNAVVLVAFVLLLLPAGAFAANGDQALKDSIEFANTAIANEEFTEAEISIRQGLANSTLTDSTRSTLRYLLGLSLSGQQRYDEAVDVFRLMLDNQPHSSKVRLALGRALFLNENDVAAKRQLDLVLADGDATPDEKQTALRYLGDIEKRDGWQFFGSVDLIFDTNSTRAPDANNRTYYVGPYEVANNNKKTSSVEMVVDVSAIHKHNIAPNQQWINQFALGQQIRSGEGDAATHLYYSNGFRQFFGTNGVDSLGMSALGYHRFRSGQSDTTSYGGRLDGQFVIGQRLRTSGIAQYSINRDHHKEERNSRLTYVHGRIDFGLTPVTNGYLQIHRQKERYNNEVYNYTNLGAEIGLRKDFEAGITGGVSFSWSELRYKQEVNNAFEKRRDTTRPLKITLLKRDWRILGVTPELEVTYFTRKSNFSQYSYDAIIYNINLTKNF